MKTTFLQKDLGGVLRHTLADLPGSGARWDASPAPTCTLYDSAGGVLAAAAAADLGPSTTLDGAAAAAQKVVPLTATTGIERWREYVLGPNAAGQWEWVTVDAIVAGVSVTVLEKLKHTYASADAFKSHDMTKTVAAAALASVARDCRAEWAFTVGGVQRKESTVFHVALYAPRLTLTSAEVLQEVARAEKLIGSAQRLDLLIRRIWERRVLPDIGRMYRPGALVSGEMAEEALLAKLQQRLAIEAKDFEAADKYADEYRAALDQLRDSFIDLNEDGAKSEDEVPRGARTPRFERG